MKTNNELVEHLVNLGVLKAPGIITAFKGINRKDFVPVDSQDFAYEDTALSIGNGQTISQPYTVAFMLELLSPQKGDNILDVGSGSGYTTALLATIVGKSGEIIGVEIIPELVALGKVNLSKYGFSNVRIYQAEKVLGFLEKAPYDKILVSASTEELPKELVDQLKMWGVMVASIKDEIWKIEKHSDGDLKIEKYPGFIFVPLVKNSIMVEER